MCFEGNELRELNEEALVTELSNRTRLDSSLFKSAYPMIESELIDTFYSFYPNIENVKTIALKHIVWPTVSNTKLCRLEDPSCEACQ